MWIRQLLITLIAAMAAICHADKVVLGSLGQTLKKTPIFASPNPRSHVYYRSNAYEYIVIKDSPKAGYYKVLMANGQYGYVPDSVVAKLPYEAVSEKPVTRDLGVPTSRAAAAEYSLNFKGTPYKWGGNDPQKGIDCSGFVKFLYGQIGVSLPRTAAEQVKVGTPIMRYEDLQKGDRLYFWSNKRNKVGHTGIYLGNGYFCHSSTSRGGVQTDFLGGKYWRETLVAARR